MITLIYGNEPYLMDYEKKKATDSVEDKQMNLNEFYEWNDSVYQIAFQYPFFEKKRIILLMLETLKVDDNLLKYIKNPCETTDLVIVANEVDKRTTLFKTLKKLNTIECNKVDSSTLRKFVVKALSDKGSSIDETTYNLLINRLLYFKNPSCSLYTVKLILEQLMFSSDVITVELVEDMVPKSLDEKAFMLANYLLDGEGSKLFELAGALLDERESPIGMLSAIMRTFRLGYKASYYKDKNPKEIASIIGVPTYQFSKATNYSPVTLSNCIDVLQDTVNEIKTGLDSNIGFKIAIARIYGLLHC